MISFEQCKHVLHYYVMKMMTDDPIQVAPHISRDCVYLNKIRGETCANISSNPMMSNILKLLHNASRIDQLNSIPPGNKCFIDGKNIPKSSCGVQLIIYSEDKTRHICIHTKYQKLCYAYFKLRNFTDFIETHIKKWLNEQTWYIPKSYSTEYIIVKILNSRVPQAIHTHLIETIDTLTDD